MTVFDCLSVCPSVRRPTTSSISFLADSSNNQKHESGKTEQYVRWRLGGLDFWQMRFRENLLAWLYSRLKDSK